MIHLALAWVALFPAQDPDRSTPEKAFESFVAFWDQLKGEDVWEKLWIETEALADPFLTDEYKAKRKKIREESKQNAEDWKTLSTSWKISGKVENKDGSVTVEAVQTSKRRQKNFQTQKVEEVEEQMRHQYVFEKSGSVWLVRQIFNACWMCKGEGTCSACKGTGKFGDMECYGCKGSKTCEQCKGEKMKEEKIAEGAPTFMIPDSEPAYSQDLSTPKSAAQAIADLKLRQDVLGTKHVREFVDRVLGNFPKFFTATIAKAVSDLMGKAVEDGKKRFRDERPAVDTVEEKGDVVTVTLKNVQEYAPRYVLKKVGGKWLIDAEQSRCYSCKGTGTCQACGGTGKKDGDTCYSCQGGKCIGCKGQGWMGGE